MPPLLTCALHIVDTMHNTPHKHPEGYPSPNTVLVNRHLQSEQPERGESKEAPMFYILLQFLAHSLMPKSFSTNDGMAEAVHISATIPIAVALINLMRSGLEAQVLVEPVSAFPASFCALFSELASGFEGAIAGLAASVT